VEKVDPYGRLLAYVWLPDGSMFNEALVREGYAQVGTFPLNVKYTDLFLEAQR
jgi:micrococcal nuclease